MFNKFVINIDTDINIKTDTNIKTNTNLFNELSTSIIFETIAKGRQCATLVNCKNNCIPIVRTTSCYNNPAQKFLPIHYNIMDHIRKKFKKNIVFNNASVEIYNADYRNMKFHTDQSLDLKEDSVICLFSCYENESSNSADIRKLQIKNKTTEQCSEISLDNNSIVLFTTSANHQHLHKIVLELSRSNKSNKSTNKWLGITFRLSKTFVQFFHDIPYIYPSNTVLRIATDNEKSDFFKHKGNENLSTSYTYPEIDYTISKSDTLPVS